MGLHSQTTRLYENRLSSCRFRFPCPTGLSPSLACRSKSTSGSRAVDQDSLPLQTTIRPATTRADREISDLGLFPLRSPLLRESLLVSLPPLIDMLKFSGWVSLNLRPQCVFIFMRRRGPVGTGDSPSSLGQPRSTPCGSRRKGTGKQSAVTQTEQSRDETRFAPGRRGQTKPGHPPRCRPGSSFPP